MILSNFIYCKFEFISGCLPLDFLADHIDEFILISVLTFVLPLISLSVWQGFKEGEKKIANIGSKATITVAAGKNLYDDFAGGSGQGSNQGGNTGSNQGNNQGDKSGQANNQGGQSGGSK